MFEIWRNGRISSIEIIAACESNWIDGGIEKAKRMIKASKDVGATYVKFQCFAYQHIWSHDEYVRLAKGMLNREQCAALMAYGEHIVGIEVFFTPFYTDALYWLDEIGVKRFKVRNTDVNSISLISNMLVTKKPIYISYDPGKMRYIAYSPEYMKVLYCVGNYPSRLSDNDFGYIDRPFISGFSSHVIESEALEAALKAREHGAEIFEFHVCLDGDDECIERQWSVQMSTLKKIVEALK